MAPRFRLKQSVLSAAVLAALAASAQGQTTPSRDPAQPDTTRQQPTTPGPLAQASDKPGVTVLPEVKVEGETPKQKNETRSGTRTETPLRDIPQFINTVPQALIRSQNATTLQDALRNVPGISYAAAEGGTQANQVFYLRGFPAQRRHLHRRRARSRRIQPRPVRHRIGRGAEGPVGADVRPRLDRRRHQPDVTKVADACERNEVAAHVRLVRPEARDGRPQRRTGDTSAVRLIALGEDSGSYRYPQDVEKSVSRPACGSSIGKRTELTLSYYYLKTKDVTDYGQPTLFTDGDRVLRALPPVSPRTTTATRTTTSPTTRPTSRPRGSTISSATRVSLRNTLRWANYKRQSGSDDRHAVARPTSTALPVTASTPLELLLVTRNHDTGARATTTTTRSINQTELTWKVATGRSSTHVLDGLELARERLDRQNYMLDADPAHAGIQAPTSATPLLNPNPFTQLSYTKTPNLNALAEGDTAALYVQDQIELSRRMEGAARAALRALQGRRARPCSSRRRQRSPRPAPFFAHRQHAERPRRPDLAADASAVVLRLVGQLVQPVRRARRLRRDAATNLNAVNENLDPEKNQNYEVGAQWDV